MGSRRAHRPPTGGEPDGAPPARSLRPRLVRLRWRLKGAWVGPVFVLALVLETALLRLLPIAGDERPSWFGAFLLAGFLNLLCVTGLGIAGGALLRRRDRSLPPLVARDRAGSVAMIAGVALVLIAGLAHRERLAAEQEQLRAAVQAVRVNVAQNAPPRFRRASSRLDVRRKGESGLYRACATGPSPREAYCVWVDTALSPPGLAVDGDRTPNAKLSGFGAPGPARLR